MPIRTRQRWMKRMKRMRKTERVSVSLPLVGDCVELQEKVQGPVSSSVETRDKCSEMIQAVTSVGEG